MAQSNRRTSLVLFLGSNIGNFAPRVAALSCRVCGIRTNDGDFVLIGFDLKKDLSTLLLAYNDPQGVTARFNFNILRRINEELGGTSIRSRISSSTARTTLVWAPSRVFSSAGKNKRCTSIFAGGPFRSPAWEPIHTESSYKFDRGEFSRLALENGFEAAGSFCDSHRYFVDALWRVRK